MAIRCFLSLPCPWSRSGARRQQRRHFLWKCEEAPPFITIRPAELSVQRHTTNGAARMPEYIRPAGHSQDYRRRGEAAFREWRGAIKPVVDGDI